MRVLPNIISVARIILCIVLLKLEPLTGMFWIIYIGCGISDIADGYIARKMNTTSELGAKLDSIADFTMVAILIIIFYPIAKPTYQILFWIVGIVIIRLLALLIGYIRFSTLAMLHTYSNKLTGLLLFLLPFGLMILPRNLPMYMVCIVATIASLEEFIIQIRVKDLDLNRKSIWIKS